MKNQGLKIRNWLMVLSFVAGLVVTGIFGVSVAKADEGGNYPPFIKKLAERFGLSEGEVEAVFDEVRQERRAQMQARFEERLSQAVTDGELTEDQKQLILAKHEELKAEKAANWESWQEMTPEERRVDRQDRRTEMEAWAEANGIDLSYFFGGQMGKKGDGFGYRFHH